MRCYRCESTDLILAPLWPNERQVYADIGVVMRQCMNCGLEQNHYGDDEPLEPRQATEKAPAYN